jgi:hypothetical protein
MRIPSILVAIVFLLFCTPSLHADNGMPPAAAKICQVTGEEDRHNPGQPTGSLLGGETGGVTGTDMGFPFEYNGKLLFLFGDSREFSPDRCEPAWCGTDNAPVDVSQPNPERVKRWRSQVEWDTWERVRSEGSDSMASAPLSFDPEQCIPLRFKTVGDDAMFAHTMNGNTVAPAVQLSGPSVASNPEDRWAVVMGSRILVVTETGQVFAHTVSGDAIAPAIQLGGPKVAANPQDKWLLAMGDRLLVITADGQVFAHRVIGDWVTPATQLGGPSVAAGEDDKWLLTMGDRLLVITKTGQVFAHRVIGDTITRAIQLGGPKVAARPQDKWLLATGNRLLVITADGGVFAHEVSGDAVADAFKLSGPAVAANWQDVRVLAMGNRLLVGTERRFQPTRLDGRVVDRDQGAIAAFVAGPRIYAFFTLRDTPLGCLAPLAGCPHGGEEPGGKTVLSQSLDGGRSFQELATFSRAKFLWAAPEVMPAGSVPDLPAGMAGPVVLVWGTGREKNALDPQVDGRIFAHRVVGDTVLTPYQLGGPMVAANLQDKWLAPLGDRLLVITTDGRVFAHAVVGDTVAPAIQLEGPKVAANPQDKWVLAMGDRLLVVTDDGRVFAHRVIGDAVLPAIQLGGPKVAANPQDKWLLVMADRLLVVTDDGRVFAHRVMGDAILPAIQLGGPRVAANPQDKWLLVMGDRLLVITADGRVFAHRVTGDSVAPAIQLGGPSVAANLQDTRLLAMGQRLLVVTGLPISQWNHSYPYLAVAPLAQAGSMTSWRYFAGLRPDGRPDWAASEALAQPLPPSDPLQFGIGYHQCLGYFSVRYIEAIRKWAMAYACNDDAKAGYNPANGPRGIYLRTAGTPWGPWSTPQRILDPGEAYCRFMHSQDGDTDGSCIGKGANPAEESVRDTRTKVTKRAWGGEYMPILLPSRYAKAAPNGTTLYFLMATWNPYQVVLMKTVLPPDQ